MSNSEFITLQLTPTEIIALKNANAQGKDGGLLDPQVGDIRETDGKFYFLSHESFIKWNASKNADWEQHLPDPLKYKLTILAETYDEFLTLKDASTGEVLKTMVANNKSLSIIFLVVLLTSLLVWVTMGWLGGAMEWGFNRTLILQGEPWRFVTCTLLHGGWVHLVINILSLLILGLVIAIVFNEKTMVEVYLLACLGASLVCMYSEPTGLMVGASGGIAGLYGAWITYLIRNRKHPNTKKHFRDVYISIGLMVVFTILSPILLNATVANAAHLGGLITGMLWVIRKPCTTEFLGEEKKP